MAASRDSAIGSNPESHWANVAREMRLCHWQQSRVGERWAPPLMELPIPELALVGIGRCTRCTAVAPTGWLPVRERLTEMQWCPLCVALRRLHLVMMRLDREDDTFVSTMDTLRDLEVQVSWALQTSSRREFMDTHPATDWLRSMQS